jgi:hypothetical protein
MLQPFGIRLFNVLREPDEFLMLLYCERLCLTLGNQLIERLLHNWWEALIDFQQELRFGLHQMWRVLPEAERKKPGDKLL